jgi:hypothetical protein
MLFLKEASHEEPWLYVQFPVNRNFHAGGYLGGSGCGNGAESQTEKAC